jgi:hypothetical protein
MPMDNDGKNAPIILLSYLHSGARWVQDLLAAGTSLGCTSGTGILPLCAGAAETWRRVEGGDGRVMSRLAVTSIRGLVTAQVTAILADLGRTRWCEVATGDPDAARWFREVFPHAVFVCVHRSCPDMIAAGVAGRRWGLHGQGLGQYLMSYPGNNVAALAAYWADATTELLAFENANPQIACRVRYEDATAEDSQALATLREWLRLDRAAVAGCPEPPNATQPEAETVGPAQAEVPLDLIPQPLRRYIGDLHAKLGYAPLAG